MNRLPVSAADADECPVWRATFGIAPAPNAGRTAADAAPTGSVQALHLWRLSVRATHSGRCKLRRSPRRLSIKGCRMVTRLSVDSRTGPLYLKISSRPRCSSISQSIRSRTIILIDSRLPERRRQERRINRQK